eukprot:1387085-Prymnesium_polylepis.2
MSAGRSAAAAAAVAAESSATPAAAAAESSAAAYAVRTVEVAAGEAAPAPVRQPTALGARRASRRGCDTPFHSQPMSWCARGGTARMRMSSAT